MNEGQRTFLLIRENQAYLPENSDSTTLLAAFAEIVLVATVVAIVTDPLVDFPDVEVELDVDVAYRT